MATLTQSAYRFRRDDGNETGAAWLAAENASATVHWTTNPFVVPAPNFRLRVQFRNTSVSSHSLSPVLQYRLYSGSWTSWLNVTPGNAVTSGASSWVTEQATTAQLTAPAGSFVAGILTEGNPPGSLTIPASDYTEVEWSLTIPAAAAVLPGDTLEFRIISTGDTWTYAVTPTATTAYAASDTVYPAVLTAAASLVQSGASVWDPNAPINLLAYRFRYDNGSETEATWMALKNTPVEWPPGVNIRLRVALYNTTTEPPYQATGVDTLEYWHPGYGWRRLSPTMGLKSSDSPFMTDQEWITQQISDPGFGIYELGVFDETDGIAGSPPQPGRVSEYEFCFQITSSTTSIPLASGTEITFRMANRWDPSFQPATNIVTPTLTVIPVQNAKVYPAALTCAATVQAPTLVKIPTPAVLSAAASIPAPIPRVLHAPAVQSAASSVQGPTGVVVATPAVLNCAATMPAPVPAIDQTNDTITPDALICTASLPSPVPTVLTAPAVLEAVSSVQAPVGEVRTLPAVLSVATTFQGLGLSIAETIGPFSAAATVQAPALTVTVTPAVLTCAATLPAPTTPFVATVLSCVASVQTTGMSVFSYIEYEEGYPRIAEVV